MVLKERFKRELEGCTIYDNFIRDSSLNGMPIEYLVFSIGKHYFALSYCKWYVISEIDKPSGDAYEVSEPKAFSRNRISAYLRQLKIINMEN